MGERHLERLFSEAYDRQLDDAERRRFEEHLAGCEQCRQGYAWYRSTVDSVRALPPARMPVPVVLPASAPVMEAGSAGRWRALVAAAMRPRPLAAAGALAAGGIAAVVIAVHVSHGGTSGTSLTARGGPAQGFSGPAPEHASVAACQIRPFAVPAPAGQAATAAPDSFPNKVVVRSAGDGQTLVLATEEHSYHPGETILVYARLVGSGNAATSLVPCVSLVRGQVPTAKGLGSAGAASGAAPGAPYAAAPDFALAAPLATAQPTDIQSPSAPLLGLVIPRDIAPGTTLTLLATVLPGTSGGGTTPLTAELTITVS